MAYSLCQKLSSLLCIGEALRLAVRVVQSGIKLGPENQQQLQSHYTYVALRLVQTMTTTNDDADDE